MGRAAIAAALFFGSSPSRKESANLQAWIEPAAGADPDRGLLLGSVSHPWLTRRRSPRPGSTIAQSMEWLRKADHRSTGAPVAVSRALATGGREKQNMDVLRASQGRVSM